MSDDALTPAPAPDHGAASAGALQERVAALEAENARLSAALRLAQGRLEQRAAEGTTSLLALTDELLQELHERESLASALRVSEARFRNAFEHAGIGKALVSLKGEWLQVNRAICRLVGYSEQELLASTFQAITHPDDLAGDLAQVGRLLRGEIEAFHLEKRYIHKAGHIVWALLSATILRDESGAPLYYLSELQDITAQKQAAEALRERELLLRSVSDNLPEGMIYQFVRSPDQPPTFRYVSAGVERLLGVTQAQAYADAEQVLGRIVPADRERFELAAAAANRDLTVFEFEGQVRTPAGRLRWSFIRSTPQRLADGAVLWSGVELDITERKLAELALASSEARFRSLVHDLRIGVVLQGPGTEVLLCNPAAQELLGLSEDQLLGKHAFSPEWHVIREDGSPLPRPDFPVAHVIASGRPVRDVVMGVYRPTTRDRIWLLVNAEPQLAPDGRVEQVICTFSDISARRLVEAERMALERRVMELQKLESMAVMAGGVAHDFNNLLTAMLGNAELLLADRPAAHPDRPGLEQIIAAGRRAAGLAKQMLAYAGRGSFVVAPVDLNAVVVDMVAITSRLVPAQVVIETRLARPAPVLVADATQLQQVLLNLLINGAEAIGQAQGTLTISTAVAQLERAWFQGAYLAPDLPAGPYALLAVVDTGVGIDEAARVKMFEPFFTTKFTGRGLGLAAVLGIVRGHGGAIRVVSAPGHGTTLTIALPLAGGPLEVAESAVEPQRLLQPAPPSQQELVLLAEDEDAVRRVTSRMLERLGFRVLAVEDGRQAVELFRDNAETIAAVLLDVTMPLLDGVEAAEAILGIRPAVPILLASGYSREETLARFRGRGRIGFIQKPYAPERLASALRELREPG